MAPQSIEENSSNYAFPPTRWSMVLHIQGEDQEKARHALEDLCGRYWYPLYSYARNRNLGPEDAEDATQAFFASLFVSDSLRQVDRERGRLRTFLLCRMKVFLSHLWRDANTLKRGRDYSILPIDTEWAEQQLTMEATCQLPADDFFDRAWALAVLDRAMVRMSEFYESRGRLELFETLKPALQGGGDYVMDDELAASLGITTPEGIRSAVFQLRRRFRGYVEEEVLETVSDPAEIQEEIGYLCRMLAMA